VVAPDASKYVIRVAGTTSYSVPPDGRIILHIPRLPSGDATYLAGVKVASVSSYDVPAVHLLTSGRTLRKLSLNDISKLPADNEGYHLLEVR